MVLSLKEIPLMQLFKFCSICSTGLYFMFKSFGICKNNLIFLLRISVGMR